MNFEAVPCVIRNADGVPTYGLLIRPLQRALSANGSVNQCGGGGGDDDDATAAVAVDRPPPESIEVGREKAPLDAIVGHSLSTTIDLPSVAEPPLPAIPPSSPTFTGDTQRSRFNPLFILASNLSNFQHGKFDPKATPAAATLIDRPNNRRSDASQQLSPRLSQPNFHPFVYSMGGHQKPPGTGIHQHHSHPHQSSSSSGRDFSNFFEGLDSADISSFLQELSYDGQELVQLDSASLNASQLEIMDSMPSASFAERLIQHSANSPSVSTLSTRFSCRYQHSPPLSTAAHTLQPYLTLGQPAHPSLQPEAGPFDLIDPPPPPPPARHLAAPSAPAAVALYPDAATPDSGIQSIGESPRSPPTLPHHSPAQPSTHGCGGASVRIMPIDRLTQPLRICTGATAFSGNESSADDSPSLPCSATELRTPKRNEYGDMPRLEPQVTVFAPDSVSPMTSEEQLMQSADPKMLVDRILSSLPPDQLASVSELLRSKLEAVKNPTVRESSVTADDSHTVVSVGGVQTEHTKAESVAVTAKKLAEYRAKMKQKRVTEQLAHEVDLLCRRLDRLSGEIAPVVVPDGKRASKPGFVRTIDWNLVKRRCVIKDRRISAREPAVGVVSEASTACLNLEQEASDEEHVAWEVGKANGQSHSLKVKIRLLRRQAESLTLQPSATAF